MIRKKLLPIWIIIAIAMTGCSETPGPEIEFVHIEGVSYACNVSSSFATFGATVESEDSPELVLPVSEGDMLYMLQDELQFYYRYRSSQGDRLTVRFDTLNGLSVYLNGNLNYMELSEPSSLEAFSHLTDPEVKQLSTILIHGTVTDNILQTIKKHEPALSGKGLVMEGGDGLENFKELLTTCQPVFLITDKLPEPEGSSCLSNLELLWLDGNISALARLARCCGSLESLIIASWEPQPGELLPLSELHKLKSLTIAESDLTSLSVIEFPQSLSSLFLVSCDTLSDIKKLEELPDLTRLGLTLCEQLVELSPIQKINSLKCLSCPPGTSQMELKELTEKHPRLELVELIGCTELENLEPLQHLTDLRGLVLQLELEQLGMLEALDQLEMLILTDEVFEDNPDIIKELRASLPNTTIVPGSGICLGSGWLIVLIPLILLFRQVFRTKK